MLDLTTHSAAVNLDKVGHEGRNVFATFPQRRQKHRKDIQTVVEIGSKLAAVRHLH